jgi:hypothetical protein
LTTLLEITRGRGFNRNFVFSSSQSKYTIVNRN